MIRVKLASIFVDDQAKALEFYTKKTLIKSTVTANCCVMRCSKCSHMSEYAALSALLCLALYSTQRFTQSLPNILGFAKKEDEPVGEHRWISVGQADEDFELVLGNL